MNDARAGHSMNTSFAQTCEAQSRGVAIAGYRAGYNAGLASTQSSQPSTLINVNIGGGSQEPRKRFYCEIQAFTKTFSAWGSTQLEAEVAAKQQCTQNYNVMHCNEISCRQ
jgi:hypothetical protein